MLQKSIGNSPCHQWRHGIAYESVLWNFLLAVVASSLSFALKNKGIVETLQSRHLPHSRGAICRIMYEIVGNRAYGRTLVKGVKHYIVALLRIKSFLLQLGFCIVIILMLGDYSQTFANGFVLLTRLMIEKFHVLMFLRQVEFSHVCHVERLQVKSESMPQTSYS